MGRFQWMEALLPLGIIAGMLCIAGNVQYTIHKAAHGRVSFFFQIPSSILWLYKIHAFIIFSICMTAEAHR